MSLIFVDLNKSIRWKIHKDDPSTLRLCSLPRWHFVNPLSNGLISNNGIQVKFEAVVGDYALVNTRHMIFVMPTNADLNFDRFNGYVEGLVAKVRYFSKQPELNGIYIENIFVQHPLFQDIDETSGLLLDWPQTFPERSNGIVSTYKILTYYLDTSVTWQHVVSADSTSQEYKPPMMVPGNWTGG